MVIARQLILSHSLFIETEDMNSFPFEELKSKLYADGFVIINLLFSNPHATYLENLVRKIGRIHYHDKKGTIVWDIKPGGLHKTHNIARSHGSQEFPIHTDCSFEEITPSHFALLVIQPDTLGGGKSVIIDGKEIIKDLSHKSHELLCSTSLKIKVPQEFFKDQEYYLAPILNAKGEFRYRRDCLLLDDVLPEVLQALDELDSLVENKKYHMHAYLPKDSILFLDNRRMLHARSQIKDSNRHLKRIRFYLED